MIILNGKKFAESEGEFINSLFSTGSTCIGYARRNQKSITLLSHKKEKIGVINRHGVLCCATKQADGKFWYSHADIPEIGRYNSHTQEVDECREAIQQ